MGQHRKIMGMSWSRFAAMYQGQVIKVAILVLATLLAGIFLFVNRGQALIGEDEFIESMIPPHSVATNNSRLASTDIPPTRELADKIIPVQAHETALIKREIDNVVQ